jgi:hypothetical protein
MFKSFSALAIFTLLGAAVIVLPAFAPKVEAREPAAFAKADRLQVRLPVPNWATEVWPHVAAGCLRSAQGAVIVEARLVTARR